MGMWFGNHMQPVLYKVNNGRAITFLCVLALIKLGCVLHVASSRFTMCSHHVPVGAIIFQATCPNVFPLTALLNARLAYVCPVPFRVEQTRGDKRRSLPNQCMS